MNTAGNNLAQSFGSGYYKQQSSIVPGSIPITQNITAYIPQTGVQKSQKDGVETNLAPSKLTFQQTRLQSVVSKKASQANTQFEQQSRNTGFQEVENTLQHELNSHGIATLTSGGLQAPKISGNLNEQQKHSGSGMVPQANKTDGLISTGEKSYD